MQNNKTLSLAALVSILFLGACSTTTTNIEDYAHYQTRQKPIQGATLEHNTLQYGDQPFFKWLQRRLDQLAPKVLPGQEYNHAKAQCWLESGKDRFAANEKKNYDYVEAALRQSARIAGLLEKEEKQAKPVYETPLLVGSVKVRDDLWKRAIDLRQEKQFSCGAKSTACAEVALVHAGHIQQKKGVAEAAPAIAIAEQLLGDANKEIKACTPKPTPTPAPPPTPTPTPTPVVETVQIEHYVLPGDALFRFGKGGLSGMLPEGRESLQTLLNTVRSYKTVDSIIITGHTDKFNTIAFNQALSERRAGTVRDWLVQQGFDASAISVVGAGKTQPLVTGCGNTRTKKTIACLQPNRRVEVLIKGIKQ